VLLLAIRAFCADLDVLVVVFHGAIFVSVIVVVVDAVSLFSMSYFSFCFTVVVVVVVVVFNVLLLSFFSACFIFWDPQEQNDISLSNHHKILLQWMSLSLGLQ